MTALACYPSPLPVIVLPLSALAVYAYRSDRKCYALWEAVARAPAPRRRSAPKRKGSGRR